MREGFSLKQRIPHNVGAAEEFVRFGSERPVPDRGSRDGAVRAGPRLLRRLVRADTACPASPRYRCPATSRRRRARRTAYPGAPRGGAGHVAERVPLPSAAEGASLPSAAGAALSGLLALSLPFAPAAAGGGGSMCARRGPGPCPPPCPRHGPQRHHRGPAGHHGPGAARSRRATAQRGEGAAGPGPGPRRWGAGTRPARGRGSGARAERVAPAPRPARPPPRPLPAGRVPPAAGRARRALSPHMAAGPGRAGRGCSGRGQRQRAAEAPVPPSAVTNCLHCLSRERGDRGAGFKTALVQALGGSAGHSPARDRLSDISLWVLKALIGQRGRRQREPHRFASSAAWKSGLG